MFITDNVQYYLLDNFKGSYSIVSTKNKIKRYRIEHNIIPAKIIAPGREVR